MAEAVAAIGIVADFAGVIGAGIALSKSLYDFAHVLGSAAEDVKSLTTDVSLLCHINGDAAIQRPRDWRQYGFYIVYGDRERCLGPEEKPLALFKELERQGKKPMFMLRKLAHLHGEPKISDNALQLASTPLPGGALQQDPPLPTQLFTAEGYHPSRES